MSSSTPSPKAITLEFNPDEIYPLPLTAFEEYFFVDSRPNLPAVEEASWYFSGKVDPALFEKALRIAISREPLLFGLIGKSKGRRCWLRPDRAMEPEFTVERVSEPVVAKNSGNEPIGRIDPRSELSGRFRLIVGSDGFVFHQTFQHAVTDGVGAVGFVALVCDIYRVLRDCGDQLDDETVREKLKEIALQNPSIVKDRANFHIELPEKTSLLVDLRYIVSETFLWFFRRPWSVASLLRRRRSADQSRKRIGNTNSVVYWRSISGATFKRYIKRSKELGVTINSLMTRDVFVAFNQWRSTLEDPKRKRRIRLLVPTNMRAPAHKDAPLVNLIGYAFLDRFSNECDRSDEFVKTIDAQMKEIVRWSVGAFFLDGLKFFRAIPGALRFLTSPIFCHSTFVFSNLGSLWRACGRPIYRQTGEIFIDDETKLIRGTGAPPARPNTPLSVSTMSTASEASFSFCFDQTLFSSDDVEAFIDAFFAELQRTMDEASE